jgi:hypothetical protein
MRITVTRYFVPGALDPTDQSRIFFGNPPQDKKSGRNGMAIQQSEHVLALLDYPGRHRTPIGIVWGNAQFARVEKLFDINAERV